ncbi:hypothetical protein NAF17_11290 [Mucilaginibacter sp. RB4R14]|uniref:hypothetical protein n=1 Tax=Mucilaginibacter aurantiaciroseus TaxID=2949308 RepID=UPI002091A02E|nr:hypothetical protein [Mucilaginibacter aurantiaciroseus]MCO5936123.1 hypothetical protein [Mucilaginibacter aurantiaciroseus]
MIKAEYGRAMKSNMNVVKTRILDELAYYLREKGVRYNEILFTGHGTIKYSSLRLGDFNYDNTPGYSLNDFKPFLTEIGNYVKPKESIILLGCFQATHAYSDPSLHIKMDGESLIKQLSKITGRNVIGNQGATYGGANEFSGVASLSSTPLIRCGIPI